MKNIIQIGFGPLGVQIGKYIAQKQGVQTVGAVDINPNISGKYLNQLDNELSREIKVCKTIAKAFKEAKNKPHAILITTVSSLSKLIPLIEEVAALGIPIVSTCEELSHPWKTQPEQARKLDDICKANEIACLGTGVNPGFLMDYLPSVLSSVCKEIDTVSIERFQDATPRRVPFQKKIGAGLNLDEFKKKKAEGILRHVGLAESVYLLSDCLSIQLDHVEEELNPIVADNEIISGSITIEKGCARGVEQIAYGFENGKCRIKMHFRAAIDERGSHDQITIKGIPSFSSKIDGGINGDIATCAITINCIKSILRASPGLHTMADISVPGFIK